MPQTLTKKQEYWLTIVKAAMESDLTLSDYAKQNNLDLKSLYSWKSQFVHKGLIPRAPKPAFTKVAVRQTQGRLSVADGATIARLTNGIELRFDPLSQQALEWLNAL